MKRVVHFLIALMLSYSFAALAQSNSYGPPEELTFEERMQRIREEIQNIGKNTQGNGQGGVDCRSSCPEACEMKCDPRIAGECDNMRKRTARLLAQCSREGR
ncbi:MAG TPA: hypothetical protein PLA97_15940 [Rubrivivax sp.]|nr:hypothetical protein [Rubrivivax sp.]